MKILWLKKRINDIFVLLDKINDQTILIPIFVTDYHSKT
jgi:hypothetical protein